MQPDVRILEAQAWRTAVYARADEAADEQAADQAADKEAATASEAAGPSKAAADEAASSGFKSEATTTTTTAPATRVGCSFGGGAATSVPPASAEVGPQGGTSVGPHVLAGGRAS